MDIREAAETMAGKAGLTIADHEKPGAGESHRLTVSGPTGTRTVTVDGQLGSDAQLRALAIQLAYCAGATVKNIDAKATELVDALLEAATAPAPPAPEDE